MCPIVAQCTDVIEVIEWKHAERQGVNKSNGKQNTQLEVSISVLPVEIVVTKLLEAVKLCRVHQEQYEWRNCMRSLDLVNSDPHKHRVICTDFGATLDLFGAEVDNSSVNNHAVICIFFVAYNWREVAN